MGRIILLLDMDAFFAMIEERENPHFAERPVVVGADPKQGKGRGVVSACNYEARKYGIHSALPISKAFQLCPSAVFLPVDMQLYSRVSSRIMDILGAYVSVVEQASLDEAYLDVSFLKDFKKARNLAESIRKEIFEKEQLPASCGIAPNKMIAKMACEKAKPNGILVIEPKEALNFLLPLRIQEIPGVGPKTTFVLERFFKKTGLEVRDVRRATREELRELLGVFGNTLYEKVRGKDNTPVVAEDEIKSIGREHTFEEDTRDGEEIFPVFRELVAGVVFELLEKGFSAKTITVVCRFQGFETHTKSKSLKEPSRDENLLSKEVMQLLLKFLTENLKPVRLVGIRLKVAQGNLE